MLILLPETIKQAITTCLILVFIIATVVGAVTINNEGKCKYDNLAKIVSVGYWVGCELFQTREWEGSELFRTIEGERREL